jgi:putative transposase
MNTRNIIFLTTEERGLLESLIRSGNAPARTQTKARILLMTDRSQGQRMKDDEIAHALMISRATVIRVRDRCAHEGLQSALYDKPRPGATPKITGDVEAQLVLLACSDPPEGHTRWTLRLLADRLVEMEIVDSISHVAVGERLKKMTSSPGK